MSTEQRIIHLICMSGECNLHFASMDHTLTQGMCLVAVDTHVHQVSPSPDCLLRTLYLTPEEHASLMPDTAWGVCGEFHLFTHPIFTVDAPTLSLLRRDVEEIESRSVEQPTPYDEMGRRKAIELFYIDLLHAHERLFCQTAFSKSYAIIMNKFVAMLKEGSYREHRMVEFYANELCITAKHLHKVSTQVSGHSPSYWIQRFTINEARFQMKRRGKTQKEVAAMLNFSDMAHFNRYISNALGITPGQI